MTVVWIFLFAFFASWASGIKSSIMLVPNETWRFRAGLELLAIFLFIMAGWMLTIAI